MSLLTAVLSIVPNNWKKENYSECRYKRFEVLEYTAEYQNVFRLFIHVNNNLIKKIERIQNPYLYGRFIIRKQQRTNLNETISELQCFKMIPEDKIDELCEYNYDYRRLNEFSLLLSEEVPGTIKRHHCVVVLKVLEGSNNCYGLKCSRDSDYYPEYVIYFEFSH